MPGYAVKQVATETPSFDDDSFRQAGVKEKEYIAPETSSGWVSARRCLEGAARASSIGPLPRRCAW